MIGKNFEELSRLLNYSSKEELERKRARLFPGGKLKTEDEVVSTNIFLSAMSGIKEFREALLLSLNDRGALKITNQTSQMHAFTEISDETGRPDGLIVITTGKRNKIIAWACYVEVKTKGKLDKVQIERYLKLAKQNKIPALITISNAFVPYPNVNPTGIVNNSLFHWSWKFVLSELAQLHLRASIEDEDQAFITRELIRYLGAHSDIKDFNNMGENWKNDAKSIVDCEKLRKTDETFSRIVSSWIQEEKDIAIKISNCELESSGCHRVILDLKREERSKDTVHAENLKKTLIDSGELVSAYNIDDLNVELVGSTKLQVSLRFRGRRLVVSMNVASKNNKKAYGQTTDLLKVLDSAGIEDEIFITANYGRKGNSPPDTLKSLRTLRELKKDYTLVPDRFKRETVKAFNVYYEKDLAKDFFKNQVIIQEIEGAVEQFYREVVSCFIR